MLTKISASTACAPHYVLQIVELRSRLELIQTDVLEGEDPGLGNEAHFVMYSPDGRYLLLATSGSNVLSIFDAGTLKLRQRIGLRIEAGERRPLGEGHRYFSGVVSVANSLRGDIFGVLTHDEVRGNEVVFGSFSSGRLAERWSLGKGRTSTQLGNASIALSVDGSTAVVSVLPNRNSLPAPFRNLLFFHSGDEKLAKALRTDGLIGRLVLLPDDTVLGARIDTPLLFSRKLCIERWSAASGAQEGRFCDSERSVIGALAASPVSGRIAGFGSQTHKTVEGHAGPVVWGKPGSATCRFPQHRKLRRDKLGFL